LRFENDAQQFACGFLVITSRVSSKSRCKSSGKSMTLQTTPVTGIMRTQTIDYRDSTPVVCGMSRSI